jgi:uncharacterized membrane protein
MLLHAHSGFRYLVLLFGLAALGYAIYGLIAKRPYDKRMRFLSSMFTGMIYLTAFVGVATLFTGVFYPQLGGHIVSMVFAGLIAHVVGAVMKRRPPEERSYGPHAVATAVALAVIAFGIMAIGRPIVG